MARSTVHLSAPWVLTHVWMSRLFTGVTSSLEWDCVTLEKETCEKFPPSACSSSLTHLCVTGYKYDQIDRHSALCRLWMLQSDHGDPLSGPRSPPRSPSPPPLLFILQLSLQLSIPTPKRNETATNVKHSVISCCESLAVKNQHHKHSVKRNKYI